MKEFLLFLSSAVKNPTIDFESAKNIVELGPGTGVLC